jgi:DNA-binding XRE family transcriptional regulator
MNRQWGENLRTVRESQGLTQQELADEVGVTQPTVVRWEAGENEPKLSRARVLARVLGWDINDLFPAEYLVAS